MPPSAGVPAPQSVFASAPARDEIVARAEGLWRQKGCPEGCDEPVWLEAEKQLCGEQRHQRAQRDKVELADPRFAFNPKKGDLMQELNKRFPGPVGRETTSL